MVKKVNLDYNLIESLIRSSNKKNASSDELKLSDITATSIISLKYDSLRELLEAISLLNGYKINNHICYVAFLIEILKLGDLANKFNSFRKLRNGINYYGDDILADDAKKLIIDINSSISVCKKLLNVKNT